MGHPPSSGFGVFVSVLFRFVDVSFCRCATGNAYDPGDNADEFRGHLDDRNKCVEKTASDEKQNRADTNEHAARYLRTGSFAN